MPKSQRTCPGELGIPELLGAARVEAAATEAYALAASTAPCARARLDALGALTQAPLMRRFPAAGPWREAMWGLEKAKDERW